MVLRKRLIADNPEGQTQEVARFLSENGVEPANLLYRVFNSEETGLVLCNGTDRSGVPKKRVEPTYVSMNHRNQDEPLYKQMGASSWDEMLGYDEKLREMGLTRADGIWVCRFDSLPKTLKPGYVAVPDSLGIAVYDPSKLTEVGTEFYAFKEPRKKLDALLAVISDRIAAQKDNSQIAQSLEYSLTL